MSILATMGQLCTQGAPESKIDNLNIRLSLLFSDSCEKILLKSQLLENWISEPLKY